MNNQISRLRNDEAVERERILTELTGLVSAESDALLVAESVMGQIDFLIAKARYAHYKRNKTYI